MKVIVFIKAIVTLCSAHQQSLLSDCSKYQPFDVVRDDRDGSYDILVQNHTSSKKNNGESKVNFYLYNRENHDAPIEILMNDTESLTSGQYDKNLPLAVIVHGWFGSATTGSARTIRTSFFRQNKKKSSNVIVLDWSSLASDETYISAPKNVPHVGQQLSEFLTWLLKITSGKWEKVHLIGYDLGAHIVGHAGRLAGSVVGRITGLDPIAPCFKGTTSSLTKFDGKYVEVIHTDCAYIRSLGIILPMGHADFYPNNCNVQPGCDNYICSHVRAYELFAESISGNTDINLKGVKCNNIWDVLKAKCNSNNTLKMGNDDYNKRGKGIYSLTTTNWPQDVYEDLSLPFDRRRNTDDQQQNRRNKLKARRKINPCSNVARLAPTLGKDIWGHG